MPCVASSHTRRLRCERFLPVGSFQGSYTKDNKSLVVFPRSLVGCGIKKPFINVSATSLITVRKCKEKQIFSFKFCRPKPGDIIVRGLALNLQAKAHLLLKSQWDNRTTKSTAFLCQSLACQLDPHSYLFSFPFDFFLKSPMGFPNFIKKNRLTFNSGPIIFQIKLSWVAIIINHFNFMFLTLMESPWLVYSTIFLQRIWLKRYVSNGRLNGKGFLRPYFFSWWRKRNSFYHVWAHSRLYTVLCL